MSLKALRLHNFTAFSSLDVRFSRGLNVIIGENAAGKSHLLKIGYAVAHVLFESSRLNEDGGKFAASGLTKYWFQRRIAEKLQGVFKPDALGRLCRRGVGRARSEVDADFESGGLLSFSFASNSRTDVVLQKIPSQASLDAPIFFPPREMLSISPGFAGLYEDRELAIDETHYDLCKLLDVPLLKGKRAHEISAVVDPLVEIMGGSVRMEAGRFYLYLAGQGKMEIALVAEGYRKVAMLAYLAANGTLTDKGMLFWDEPEANLNPRIVTRITQTIAELVRRGVQVVLATHSLFLMKELSLVVEQSKRTIPCRFFGLRPDAQGITLEEGELLEDLQTIVALDEALKQDDREQVFFLEES